LYLLQHRQIANSTIPPQHIMKIFIFLFLGSLASSLPAPQSEDEISTDNRIVNIEDEEDKESKESETNLGEILGLFGQIGNDLLSLAREKGKLVTTVIQDKDFQDRVSNLVQTGVNGTRQLVKASGPIVQQFRSTFSNTSRLASNVVKAAGQTAPLAQETLEEYQNQAPLLSGIARSYAEINIQAAQNVAKSFHESLRCNNECGDLEGDLLEECKEKNCNTVDE